jgi:hypothetical protein
LILNYFLNFRYRSGYKRKRNYLHNITGLPRSLPASVGSMNGFIRLRPKQYLAGPL